MAALKDILLETNITFTPEGMKIANMDKSHTILAHLFLKARSTETKTTDSRLELTLGLFWSLCYYYESSNK